jgi:hypothetical protein
MRWWWNGGHHELETEEEHFFSGKQALHACGPSLNPGHKIFYFTCSFGDK